jgi:hypothetical protein
MSLQAGKENERKWEEYWNGLRAQGKYLPVKVTGEVNITQVGRDSNIGRENLYKNPNIYPRLLAAISETIEAQRMGSAKVNPISGISAATEHKREDAAQKQVEIRDRRIKDLEEKLAVLAAENYELRSEIKILKDEKTRFELIENMISETGRRILPH